MAEVRTVPVGPIDLAVAEAGRGGRPLLLVHGFTGWKEDFEDHLDAFAAEGWWVVAPDLRGHGASGAPTDEAHYALDAYVDDLVALVDHLGWSRFAVLGHSMGGMIVGELVLAHPERVAQLVLMDTNHGPVEGLDADVVALAVDVLRTQGLEALLELAEQLPKPPPAPSEQRLRDTRPGHVEWSDRKVRCCSPAMYAAMAQILPTRVDRLDDLAASVAVPTLVVVGAEDASFLPSSQRLAEAIGGAELVVVPDAAHSPQLEHPEAWFAAVAGFLARTAPAPDAVVD